MTYIELTSQMVINGSMVLVLITTLYNIIQSLPISFITTLNIVNLYCVKKKSSQKFLGRKKGVECKNLRKKPIPKSIK